MQKLFRILTVFLAGVILFVSTACSPGNVQAKGLSPKNNPRPELPDSAITNTYEGGMNDFSDVDPRFDTSPADAKAEALEKNARHNISAKTGSPVEAIGRAVKNATKAGDNVKETGEDIADKTNDAAKDFTSGTQRGIENLKSNTQDAADDVADSLEGAKNKAGKAAEKTKQSLDKAFHSND